MPFQAALNDAANGDYPTTILISTMTKLLKASRCAVELVLGMSFHWKEDPCVSSERIAADMMGALTNRGTKKKADHLFSVSRPAAAFFFVLVFSGTHRLLDPRQLRLSRTRSCYLRCQHRRVPVPLSRMYKLGDWATGSCGCDN